MTNDTIFAVATGAGRAGVAIVRVSGPASWDSASRLCGGELPEPRFAALRDFRDDVTGELLDTGLLLLFESGRSFSGEKTVEYHIHGSYATQLALTEYLGRQEDHRHSEPGEFSRRAFENGCMDLSQLEGLADLIDAETALQRKLAQDTFRGSLADIAADLRSKLVRALALIESTLDFSDEELPEGLGNEAVGLVLAVEAVLHEQIGGAAAARQIREGFEVAIIGPPNVGKSTLMNAISGREAALTSEVAGTTRDIVEVRFDLAGLPVVFLDTAGIRDTDDTVERLGVHRARKRAKDADLRIVLVDQMSEVERLGVELDLADIVVLAKADTREDSPNSSFAVSGHTGLGVDELLDGIRERLEDRTSGASFAARERHRIEMVAGTGFLEEFRDHFSRGVNYHDIAAEDIRKAISSIDRIVGKVDVEDLLDEIFSSFCLGK